MKPAPDKSPAKNGLVKKDTTKKKTTLSIPRTRRAIEKRVREVLIELMQGNAQHSVRLGAIKELKELIGLKDKLASKPFAPKRKSEEERRNDDEEHAATLADARALLAEIAEAKSGRVAEPREVDQGGAAGATDAEG
ncbi:MAG: hypothetical protein PHY92_01495 [Alphaproteobacteria bacterium]|nr:hypothetical protein [Alphaproteobacteria bacterium]